MPQSKISKAQNKKAKTAKPVKAKAAKPKPAAAEIKPAKVKTEPTKPEVKLPQAAAAAREQQATPPDPALAKPKIEPPHPGKQEQPMWARFNHGHNQKMPRGRVFRHQGR